LRLSFSFPGFFPDENHNLELFNVFSCYLNNDLHFFAAMCDRLSRGGIAAVVDMAWGGWIRGRKAAADMGMPYVRLIYITVEAA
jgi:hypothetical protein